MNTSDSGWFKKFLGENPSAKALRERLEEATALLASKDEALVEQERRLTDATALAQRETESARALEARVRDLTEAAAETELSRSVTVELLKQAETQSVQMADALAAERAKLIAANQAKVKAETNARALTTHVQKLEKQVLELSSKVTSLEHECTSSQEAKATLETALARSERRRENTLAELTESRTTGEKLSIACENWEARAQSLEGQLEAAADALRVANAESARGRTAAAELLGVAVDALYAAVGHAIPVALRVGVDRGTLSTRTGATAEMNARHVAATLERWLSDAGLRVSIKTESPENIVIEVRGDTAAGDSKVAMGYWIGGLTMHSLRVVGQSQYRLFGVQANDNGATVSLELVAATRATV